jgi:hypothetical protein
MKMKEKICPVCNKTFMVHNSHFDRRVTCSYKCVGILRRKLTVTNRCLSCGKFFVAKKSRLIKQTFCSKSCHQAYRSGSLAVIKTCLWCGKKFRVIPSRILHNLKNFHCSKSCRIQSMKQRSLEGNGCIESIRKRMRELRGEKCEKCGYASIPQLIVLHHKKGKGTSNHPSNLILLCPTCHAEEHFNLESRNNIPSWR